MRKKGLIFFATSPLTKVYDLGYHQKIVDMQMSDHYVLFTGKSKVQNLVCLAETQITKSLIGYPLVRAPTGF